MLKIYGIPRSRAWRCLWLARELGIEYESVPVHFKGGAKAPEYLAVNPNGRIPALVDGDLVLWESMAMNLYLVKKHGGPLAPATLVEEAHTLKWSFWVMTECENPASAILAHRFLWTDAEREEKVAKEAEIEIAPALRVIDGELAGRDYLVADRFMVADLNVASVLSWLKAGRMDISPYPNLNRWLRTCLARPAQKAALEG